MTKTYVPIMAVAVVVLAPATAAGQPAGKPPEKAMGETTVLVAPGGSTADVPVHFTDNVMLTFPSAIVPRAVRSGPGWQVNDFEDTIMVRATATDAAPITLAAATKDGAIRVNVSLRVVPDSAPALKVVRFQASSAEDAFQSAVAAAVERETAPLRAELANARKALDRTIRDRADALVAQRLVTRHETVKLKAHERNDDNVIVHVGQAVFLGEDAYLLFEIENRSGSAYRLAKVSVVDATRAQRAGPVGLTSSSTEEPEAGVIGVVPAGRSGQGAVVLRQVDAVLGKQLELTIEQPGGRGKVTVGRGIVLR